MFKFCFTWFYKNTVQNHEFVWVEELNFQKNLSRTVSCVRISKDHKLHSSSTQWASCQYSDNLGIPDIGHNGGVSCQGELTVTNTSSSISSVHGWQKMSGGGVTLPAPVYTDSSWPLFLDGCLQLFHSAYIYLECTFEAMIWRHQDFSCT